MTLKGCLLCIHKPVCKYSEGRETRLFSSSEMCVHYTDYRAFSIKPVRTGLYDSKGIEMLAGDKVKTLFWRDNPIPAEIIWDDECAKFKVKINEDDMLDFGYVSGDELEVILEDGDPRKEHQNESTE